MRRRFRLGMIRPSTISVPLTAKCKRRWFVRSKGQMINRVFYGGYRMIQRIFPNFILFLSGGLGILMSIVLLCGSTVRQTVFAAFLFCFVAFLLYSIVQQVSSPFELRYHAYFVEDVESWMIIAADWVAILACSFSIIGIVSKSNYHRRWLWCSFFISILLSVFWLYFMMRLPRFRWDVIWRPFGPLSVAGICLYVDHLLAESSEEIRKLRGYMYAYKAT
ncbi:uncharacterized protein LOC111485278 isoform X1 [Cucurbita maxima]|uniref:Uncharacterized protein LOC111485278 isoform X1 n=1 Tax=Cucurbita maxima TaxID=3661 RepID=A0A6J1JK12_CUCMA|nr:uncharacterized protein LOC111485278 isoform X1 [Cucurbita maxima]